MADNLYVPQVDYTSRDFTSIRDDLLSLIPNFAPQWTSRDSNDFGVVLVELFAYMGDLLNYYVDRAANESFISTSTQRDTVVKLAKLLNYTPNSLTGATGTVTFSNSTPNAITVVAGAVLNSIADAAGNQITFETSSSVTVPAVSGSVAGTASVGIKQGQTTTETIGLSDGTAYQTFKLSNSGVLTNDTMTVLVGATTYTKVPYTIDYGPNDNVYSVYTDGTGSTYIQFGDGISGKIPPSSSAINISYRYTTTAGSLGNVAANTVISVVSDNTGASISGVSVTNPTACSGGQDAESTDSIRLNAPLALRSLNRAVSLRDYSQLAVQVPGIAKANAAASNYTQVTLYIAASGGYSSSTALKNSVTNYFAGKTPPNTSISIYDFTPVFPYLSVTVNVLPQYDPIVVQGAVTSALYSLFGFDNVVFNDNITQGDVYSTIRAVDGVAYVTITDYEKLATASTSTSIYTQVATTVTTIASGATISAINVSDIAGIPVGYTGTVSNIISSIAGADPSTVFTTTPVVINSLIPSVTKTTTAVATGSGPVLTYTSNAHGFVAGQTVSVTGYVATNNNVVNAVITTTAANTFTVSVATAGTAVTATGTAVSSPALGLKTAATTTAAITGTSTINVQAYGGINDLYCNIDEVPILEATYINVTTTGGIL
jgi:hypothetical protein